MIEDGFREIWSAWHRLSQDREWISGGMGPPIPQRITWRSVVDWCDYYDVPPHQVDLYDSCFAAMDEVFMEWRAAHIKRG